MISFDEDSGPGQAPVHGIFIANADGTGGRQLTTAPDVKDAYDTQSQWSPDGKRIVFAKFTPIGKKDGRVDIYTMTPKGTALKRVTHMPQAFTNNADWGRAPHS
jgi:Tol biopolymer transport system component